MVIFGFEDENRHSNSTVSGDVMESLQCTETCREPHRHLECLHKNVSHLTFVSQEIDPSLLDNPVTAAAIHILEQRIRDQELQYQAILAERDFAIQRAMSTLQKLVALEPSAAMYELELSRSIIPAFPNVSHPAFVSTPSVDKPASDPEPLCASLPQVLECTFVEATQAQLPSSKDACELSILNSIISSSNLIKAKKPLQISVTRHPGITSLDVSAVLMPSNKFIKPTLSRHRIVISSLRARSVRAKAFTRVSSAFSSCADLVWSSVNALMCLNAFRHLLRRRSLKRRKLKSSSLTCRLELLQHPAGFNRRFSLTALIMVRCVDPT